MFWIAATFLFGLVSLTSAVLALRSEDRQTLLWLSAVSAALVCGIAFSSYLEDGRLTARIDELTRETEQLRRDNAALSGQADSKVTAARLPVIESEQPASDASKTPDDEARPVIYAAAPDGTTKNEPVGSRDAPEAAELVSAPPRPSRQVPQRVAGTNADSGSVSAASSAAQTFVGGPDAQHSARRTVAGATREAETAETNGPPPSPVGYVEPDSVEPDSVEPGSVEPGATDESGLDLSGRWELRTVIEQTSYPSFLGTELVFRVRMTQEGGRLRAEGEKVAERLAGGAVREYAPGSRTPIVLAGEYSEDGRLDLQFGEEGAARSSQGAMLLTVASPTRLQGRFSSSAASSAGQVTFERLNTED